MRKKIFVFVLILFLGSGVLLFSPGCAGIGSIPEDAEIKYDIQGQWTINRIFDRYTLTISATFTGDKKNGTMVPESGNSGPYNVGGEDGVQVEYYFSYYENGCKITEQYRGRFTNEKFMNGTGIWSEYIDGHYGKREFAWGATRN